MSIKEMLGKIKKPVLLTGLAITSIGAPIRANTTEKIPTEPDPITASAVTNIRQQKLVAAVRAGLPAEEIAQYVDFPDFIPATKDGKFDVKRADKLSKKLKPYMKTLSEKGDKITLEEAYEVYKQSMQEDAVSFDEFKKVSTSFTDQIAQKKKDDKTVQYLGLTMGLFLTGLVLAGSKREWETWGDVFKSPTVQVGLFVVNALPIAFALTPLVTNNQLQANRAYQRMYDSYLQSTIEHQKGAKPVQWQVPASTNTDRR